MDHRPSVVYKRYLHGCYRSAICVQYIFFYSGLSLHPHSTYIKNTFVSHVRPPLFVHQAANERLNMLPATLLGVYLILTRHQEVIRRL